MQSAVDTFLQNLRSETYLYIRIVGAGCRLFIAAALLVFVLPITTGVLPPADTSLVNQITSVFIGVLNALFFIIVQMNLVATSYTPFGKTVSSKNAFLTAFSGQRTELAVAVLALTMVYVDRHVAEGTYTFVVDTMQDATLNLTAYALALDDVFTATEFQDALTSILQDQTYSARIAILCLSVVYPLITYVIRDDDEDLAKNKRHQWRIQRFYLNKRYRAAIIGKRALGPVLRNAVLALAVGTFVVMYLFFQIGASESDSDDERAQIAAIVLVAGTLIGNACFKILRMYSRGKYSELTFAEIIVGTQLVGSLALRDLRLHPQNSYYAPAVTFGFLFGMLAVYFLSFGNKALRVMALTVRDFSKFWVRNYLDVLNSDPINKIFRGVFPLAIVLGLIACFTALFSISGNFLEFDFQNGEVISDVQEVIDRVEASFDTAITQTNAFIRSVTPCSTTDYMYDQTATFVREPQLTAGAATYTLETFQQMQTRLFSETPTTPCFVDANTWLLPSPTTFCNTSYFNWLEVKNQQLNSTAERGTVTAALAAGLQNDPDFRDDEGLEETKFQVIKVDPRCEEAICIAFTATTISLFFASLFPFFGSVAVAASKAVNIAFRVGRIGRNLLKGVRQIYAKRKKLNRFIKLLKKISAIGSPVLKFGIVSYFMYIPTALVGVLCVLLGYFNRDIYQDGQRSILTVRSVQIQLFILFVALAVTNLGLYLTLFWNDFMLNYIRAVLKQLPESLIVSTVHYGAGGRYLQYTLLFSCLSSAFFALTLAIDVFNRTFLKVLGKICRSSRRRIRIASRYASRMSSSDSDSETSSSDSDSDTMSIGAENEQEEIQLKNTVSSIVVATIIALPVVYFVIVSYNNPSFRWVDIRAQPDERFAEISEQILNNELIEKQMGGMSDEFQDNESTCGMIGQFVKTVFEPILAATRALLAPITVALVELRETSRVILGQVRSGIITAVDLNIPYSIVEWTVSLLFPMLFVIVLAATLVITVFFTNLLRISSVIVFLNNVDLILISLALMGLQANLFLLFILNTFSSIDMPLFQIEIVLGDAIIYGLASSAICFTSALSLYINRLVPLA